MFSSQIQNGSNNIFFSSSSYPEWFQVFGHKHFHTLLSASCSYIFTLSFFLLYRRSQPGPLALPLSSPATLLLFFLQLSKILLISESGTCPPNSFFLTRPRNPDSKLQRVLG